MATENKTILDIAREAGVSPATVSRVLSGYPNVSAATQARVQAVVDKYRFKPNSMARGLLQKSSGAFGIIMPDITHPYYAGIFSAAQEEARRHGYVVQLYRLAQNAMITDEFVNQLIERRLDGVLLSGGFIESTNPSDLPAVLTRLQRYMPIVTICPPIPGLSCINIYTDLASGARKLVRHLYTLGHRHIAFIGSTQETRSVGEREHGYVKEMLHLSLEPVQQPETIHTPATGEQAILKLLASNNGPDRPTALIAVNDLMALGALHQLTSMGFRLPQDMAVVGCDNAFFSAFTSPPLTTLEVHSKEHGTTAMRQLLQTRQSGSSPFTQVLEPTLIVRESCGAQLDRRVDPLLP